MTGIRGGEAPEVADLVRDRIDTELEMAKSLMQQEFEETIESEQVCLTSMVYIVLPSQKSISTLQKSEIYWYSKCIDITVRKYYNGLTKLDRAKQSRAKLMIDYQKCILKIL